MDSKRSPRGEKLPAKNRAVAGRFKKGQSGNPAGRKPGVPNKTTASVKAALVEAFEGIGGVESLIAWGKTEPTEFYKLWAKMLPQEVTGADGGPIETKAEVAVTPDPARATSIVALLERLGIVPPSPAVPIADPA